MVFSCWQVATSLGIRLQSYRAKGYREVDGPGCGQNPKHPKVEQLSAQEAEATPVSWSSHVQQGQAQREGSPGSEQPCLVSLTEQRDIP